MCIRDSYLESRLQTYETFAFPERHRRIVGLIRSRTCLRTVPQTMPAERMPRVAAGDPILVADLTQNIVFADEPVPDHPRSDVRRYDQVHRSVREPPAVGPATKCYLFSHRFLLQTQSGRSISGNGPLVTQAC